MCPCVITLRVAGNTMIPVKIGTKSHTRFTKNDKERFEAAASPSVSA